jgi:hypothetical protein
MIWQQNTAFLLVGTDHRTRSLCVFLCDQRTGSHCVRHLDFVRIEEAQTQTVGVTADIVEANRVRKRATHSLKQSAHPTTSWIDKRP